MMDLTQKLTKSMPRRCSVWDIYTSEKYLCKKLGNKDGGRCLLEGGVFSGAYGNSYVFVSIYISNILWK